MTIIYHGETRAQGWEGEAGRSEAEDSDAEADQGSGRQVANQSGV